MVPPPIPYPAMSKKRRNGDADMEPLSSVVLRGEDIKDTGEPTRPRKRRANVYDAVAGRATKAGLLGHVKDPKASKQPLRPDEVLFKRKNAPTRYAEDDYYHAHAKLPAGQRLPSGDLLSAVSTHVSKLYSKQKRSDKQRIWRSMNETALIAIGILMEETAREVLGKTGDLAFTEAADEEEERALSDKREQALAGSIASHQNQDSVSAKEGAIHGQGNVGEEGQSADEEVEAEERKNQWEKDGAQVEKGEQVSLEKKWKQSGQEDWRSVPPPAGSMFPDLWATRFDPWFSDDTTDNQTGDSSEEDA